MSVFADLLIPAGCLSLIGGSVGLVALAGRNRDADVHDLSDYREPDPADAPWAETSVKDDDVIWNKSGTWPAWPPVDRKSMPPRRALRRRRRAELVESIVPTRTDDEVRDIADRFLREIRDEALAGAR